MVSSFTSRPVSSLRDQPVSPSSSQSDSPAFRAPAHAETRLKQRHGSGESFGKSPLLDDRHSSPDAASLRSSDYSSVYSISRRSASTALTPVNLDERLPSITSLDFSSDKHSRTSTLDSQSRWQDHKMSAIDKVEARRSSPPPAPVIRRPNSPAGRISNHSAEWDMHSDRGSPRSTTARLPVRVAPPASHSSYPAEYPPSPRMSSARSADPYRDIHPSFARDRPASPTLVGIKRKSSIPDNALRRAPAARMERPGRSWPENQRPSLDYYADRSSYYRGRDRNESPERSYASSHDHSAYAPPPRYAPDDDARYSPRRIYPASPSTRGDYSRGAPQPYHGSYAERRPDRYSPGPPMRSPPYASRNVPPPHVSHHDPYVRSASHAYPQKTSSPPTGSDPRPQLPPLSSRPPPSAAEYSVRSRYTPPPEAVLHPTRSRSPEVAPYPEAFYPDRRLFFARDRIQDPEMDEYYHGPAGSQRKAADYDYDAYSSSHAAYAHGAPVMKAGNSGMMMSSSGVPLPMPASASHGGMRGPIDGRRGYPASYGPPEYMPDPRDPHGHMAGRPVGRPGPTFPAALVPPGPSTGIAPPPRRRGKLPKPVTDLLKSWLLEHAGHPYPTEDEKRTLCSMTGLTLSQVSNWFINARRRILLPSGSNGSPNGTSTAAQVKAAFSADSASPEP